MQPDDRALLVDILVTGQRLDGFMKTKQREDLDEDYQLQLAAQKALEIIGEAAAKISRATRDEFPDVPWAAIVGMRHHLVHDYSRVDLDIVWEVVAHDLPELIRTIEAYIGNG
jgi:uncharacterized protein with HEPN domain